MSGRRIPRPLIGITMIGVSLLLLATVAWKVPDLHLLVTFLAVLYGAIGIGWGASLLLDWNDEAPRTQAEVVEAFERAAEREPT